MTRERPTHRSDDEQQVVVIGPDGQPMGTVPASALAAARPAGERTVTRATRTASARSPTWSSSPPR